MTEVGGANSPLTAALVPVAVLPAPTAARARLVSLRSPSGNRVNDVTLDEAALLLRALA